MRKHVKFLAMILAALLMLEVAPLALFADSGDPGTYQGNGQETTNDAGTLPEGTETPSEPVAPVDSDSLTLDVIEWRSQNSNADFYVFDEDTHIDVNEVLLRLTFSEKVSRLTVKIDEKEASFIKMLNYGFLNTELSDGLHKMDIYAVNDNGEVNETVYFYVDGDEDYPVFELETPASLLRGESVEIRLNGTNLQNVDSLSMTLAMDRSFSVENVILPDGVVGMYMWYRGELQIVADVVDASKITDDCLAVICIKAPTDASVENFTWTVKSSEIVLTEESGLGTSDGFTGGIHVQTPEMGVAYAYTVEYNGPAVKGAEYTLSVVHYNGSAVVGAPIYAVIDGEDCLIGITDEDGKLTTTFFDTYESYTVYAKTEDGVVSDTVTIACMTPSGDISGVPYGITVNSPVYNGKSVSWMSNVLGSSANAILRLSTVPTMSNAAEIVGTSVTTYYNDGESLNRVNTVSVTDLAPGMTYYYQIGDGTIWSEVHSFTVRAVGESVSFAVLGTVTGSANANCVVNAIMNGGTAYDFAIQTGNAISDPSDYAAWVALHEQMNGLTLDTIRALSPAERGNKTIKAMYGIDGDAYSYEIGNVYMAVVNGETVEELKELLYWVYDDAKTSACAWKLLVIHTPVYAANDAAYNAAANQWVPYFAEAAGIDVVFSGADGSYGRTDSLKEGAITNQNGVTYVNVGSMGAKPETFAAGSEFAFASNEFNAMYLGVTATADELIITAYNVAEDGTVTVMDSVTKVPYVCDEYEHTYRINYTTNSVICSVCDHRVPVREYTGPFWLGQDMYFSENGAYKTGWVTYNGDVYYFAPKGLNAVNGEYTISGYTYVFEDYKLKLGAWFERDGYTMLKWAGITQRQTWFTMDGETYYFDANGNRVTGLNTIYVELEDGTFAKEYHLFDENGCHQGRLEDGLHVFEDLVIYTIDGVAQQMGLVMDAEGNYYYIGSSREAVRNVTRSVTGKWTNDLLPAGTYTFGADGKMIDPPALNG